MSAAPPAVPSDHAAPYVIAALYRFARFGQFLPPHDSRATLDVIEALVDRTGAQALFSLGDSFHDSDGAARLDPQARDRLSALTERLDWTCLLYTSPSPRDKRQSRMPSSA